MSQGCINQPTASQPASQPASPEPFTGRPVRLPAARPSLFPPPPSHPCLAPVHPGFLCSTCAAPGSSARAGPTVPPSDRARQHRRRARPHALTRRHWRAAAAASPARWGTGRQATCARGVFTVRAPRGGAPGPHHASGGARTPPSRRALSPAWDDVGSNPFLSERAGAACSPSTPRGAHVRPRLCCSGGCPSCLSSPETGPVQQIARDSYTLE
jgi:hypothetical protein